MHYFLSRRDLFLTVSVSVSFQRNYYPCASITSVVKLIQKLLSVLSNFTMTNWKEKIIVITGASSGIGEGTALHFAKLGAKLFITGRNGDNLQKTKDQCVQLGLPSDNIGSVVGDITDKADQSRILSGAIEKYGKIDVLVNNAGMVHFLKIEDTSDKEYDEMFDTNVKAQFMLTKAAMEYLKQTKGNIVFVSSICGSRPMGELPVYCMSKAAIDMFTQCLALELAPFGVRVNTVSPGAIVSKITRRVESGYQSDEDYQKFLVAEAARHPLGRVGVPQDVASSISFLASDEASFISGQILYVDGARHCVTGGITTSVK
ncbi:uncharacterized oxidoreductase TM_0325-like isoform X1 [Mytilus californianus]|uniref:uncharacterized oxidoreductase TM_0325-like isoform X1 n=2 Tax=Mytilus californianus TaxID=6549 RepID=UPI002246E97F|nr:uncharacterized oxidoreductase TM_0325-like isoform X1 [Mytilus californianus]